MHNELYKGNRRITFYKPDPYQIHFRYPKGKIERLFMNIRNMWKVCELYQTSCFSKPKINFSKAHYNKNNAVRHEEFIETFNGMWLNAVLIFL